MKWMNAKSNKIGSHKGTFFGFFFHYGKCFISFGTNHKILLQFPCEFFCCSTYNSSSAVSRLTIQWMSRFRLMLLLFVFSIYTVECIEYHLNSLCFISRDWWGDFTQLFHPRNLLAIVQCVIIMRSNWLNGWIHSFIFKWNWLMHLYSKLKCNELKIRNWEVDNVSVNK